MKGFREQGKKFSGGYPASNAAKNKLMRKRSPIRKIAPLAWWGVSHQRSNSLVRSYKTPAILTFNHFGAAHEPHRIHV